MSKSLLCSFFIVAFAMLRTAPTAPVPDDTPLYFATTLGTTWEYQFAHREVTTTEMVTKVQRLKDLNYRVTVSRDILGELQEWDEYEVSPSGVLLVEGERARFDTPLCLLRVPAKKSERWGLKTTFLLGSIDRGVRTTTGFEAVAVPAGKYTTIRVEQDLPRPGGQPVRVTYWYAAGVGLVKVLGPEGEGYDRVLKTFTPGKD